MGITINGSSAAGNIDLGTNGTITDLAVGGLPDGVVDAGTLAAAMARPSFRNLIINGEFQVAERTTAAITTSSGSNEGYQTVDRWQMDMDGTSAAFTQQQVNLTAATDPDGFYKAFKIDCTTADASVAAGDWASLIQNVEGFNWAQLNYGRSDAKTITVSFWVKSTKTGTYSFSIRNSAADRYYIAEYTVSSSNTWEKKTITIAGDTSGTWLTTNGIGARLGWSLIIGSTDSATAGSWNAGNKFGSTNQVNFFDNTSNDFYITGVQLEIGSAATDFEHRTYGDELTKCQRYYFKFLEGNTKEMAVGWYYHNQHISFILRYPTTMRAVPTGHDVTGTNYYIIYKNNGYDTFDGFVFENGSTEQYSCYNNSDMDGDATHPGIVRSYNANAKIEFDAEL